MPRKKKNAHANGADRSRSSNGNPRPSSKPQGWFSLWIAISLASLLVVPLVYYFLPLGEVPIVELPKDLIPGIDEVSTSEPMRPTPVLVQLPRKPIEIETKAEQDRLLAEVEYAVSSFPQNAAVMHIAALTYAELLQTEKATQFFNRAIQLDPVNPEILGAYSKTLLQLGKQQEAIDLLKPIVTSGRGTPSLIAALGNAGLELGEPEEALQTLEAGFQKHPKDPAILLRLCQAEVQLEKFEDAVKHAKAAIALGQTDKAVYMALSTALLRLGRKEEALEVRAKQPAIEGQIMPDDEKYKNSFRQFASHTYGMLANVYLDQGKQDKAEAWLAHSLALEPAAIGSLVSLADLARKKGNIQQAIDVYRRLIEVQPDNLINYHNLASLAVSTGEVSLAESTLVDATKMDASGNSDLQVARFMLGVGKPNEATKYARKAVDRLRNADAYLLWIASLQGDGKGMEAMEALIEAKRVAPNDPRLLNVKL